MFSLLPTSLLALLFASPSLAVPTTPNDLFHAIAVHAPKEPDQLICCLRPLPPLEPAVDEDILLSFEDWKAKRLSEVKDQETPQVHVGRPHKASENLSEATSIPDTSHSSTQAQGSVPLDVQDNGGASERLAPHFRIPITDRFNYASLDCSARVHASHKSAKSASSILSSKKDRYMLSPCAEEKQFVIVELCEDIRIDTVQLADYEFFSGVFKDFSVSVAKTYTTDPKDWTLAGTFRAKNVRGVQSFHPPPTLRDFYRLIRIDFHSHYGNEYYCPVSLLRVYGLTQLEEWQWETWEAEGRAKRSIEDASPPVEVVVEPPRPVSTPATESQSTGNDSDSSLPASNDSMTAASSNKGSAPVTSAILNSLQYNVSSSISAPPNTAAHDDAASQSAKSTTQDASHDTPRHPSDSLYHTHVSLSSSPSPHVHSIASDNYSSPVFIDHRSDSSHSSPSARSSSATSDVSSLSTVIPSYVAPAPPVSTGGESIYRTIMNRLTALEANTTLYARYVEEQTSGMREVLQRLTEDIGRLEGIGNAQAQLYQRSVVELEKQTRRLEDEQRELITRVNYLTDEVVLEKRLGIAQLCLLLTVLIFMALTRGSRGEYTYHTGAQVSVREWGRRTLSFSGDLVSRFRTRSETPPRVAGQKAGESEIAFPTLDVSVAPDEQPRNRRTHAAGSRKGLQRPHTPTVLRTPNAGRHLVHHRVGAPAPPSFLGPRPAIQRSSSGSITLGGFGGVGPVPRSAKRWARSAHLHEVKSGGSPRRQAHDGQATPVPSSSSDVLVVDLTDADGLDEGTEAEAGAQILVIPPPPPIIIERSETLGKGKGRAVAGSIWQPSPLRPARTIDLSSPPNFCPQADGETSEGDVWVDTDVSGSEGASELGEDVAALRERDRERERERERTCASIPQTATNSSL